MPKRPKQPRLTREEFVALDAALSSASLLDMRDRCALHLMGSTGLRTEEALLCLPEDFRRYPGTLYAPTVKKRSPRQLGPAERARANMREIPCAPEAAAVILAWIEARPPCAGPLLCAVRRNVGAPVQGRYYRRRMEDLGWDVLDRHVHPHMLRHYANDQWKAKGIAVEDRMRLFDHESINTTMLYDVTDMDALRTKLSA